jgi:predicted ATPase
MHLKRMVIDQGRFPTREAYPFNLPVLQKLEEIAFPSPVTLFVGENGSGKSTLLQALCRRCNIHIWEGMYRARVKSSPYESMLPSTLNIDWANGPVPGSFFSPELFRNFSQLVEEWSVRSPDLLDYFGGRSLVTQSHGQSCMAYFRSIYRVKGLHFLDEPEAALSPKTQLELRAVLNELSCTGHAQFIISTHSPILMSLERATLYSFGQEGISPTTYQATEHYKVYKEFFAVLDDEWTAFN